MIDSTHLKVHRTAASLRKKGGLPLHRTNQRGAEYQAPRRLRRPRQARGPASDGRADERS
jgi:hypothetical protein